MYLTKNQRKELSDLSQEVFGTRSRWQKMVTKGNSELITRKVTEIVEAESGDPKTVEKTVPVLTASGVQQFENKYYTVEGVKEYMIALKKQRDEILALIQKQNEERKQKALEEAALLKLQEENGGSAF